MLNKKGISLIIVLIIIITSFGCGKTQRALEDGESAASQSIVFSNSPYKEELAAVAWGLGEFLGLKQPSYSSGSGGLGALAIYVHSNRIPKFYDDKNILAVNIDGPNGDWYQQDYPAIGSPPAEDENGTYQVSKIFRYNPISSVPINHDQGSFTREMYTSVTRNPGTTTWRNRTTHCIVNRVAEQTIYNSADPFLQLSYINRETDNQDFGEGRITLADGTTFDFFNFKITSEINQSIDPADIDINGTASNATYYGEINPNEGVPYLYLDQDTGEIKINYHNLKTEIVISGVCLSNDTHHDKGKDAQTLTISSGKIIMSENGATYDFGGSLRAYHREIKDLNAIDIKVLDWEGNDLFPVRPIINTRTGIVTFGDLLQVYYRFYVTTGAGSWDYFNGSGTVTLLNLENYIGDITKLDDGEKEYRVWVDNGQVMFEQKPKQRTAVQIPVSNYVNATKPAISKIGSKIYITWVQDDNKLYMNVIDLAGSIILLKKGNGTATVDLDFCLNNEGEILTGNIHLENYYVVTTRVTYVSSNMGTGGVEEVVVSEPSSITANGTVYRYGEKVGFIKGGDSLFNGDIVVVDDKGDVVDPKWFYIN
ncbi:MAG: hypothetical protein KKA19_05430 [Candidatus Margulisbacteria bacterium]|nr:hypothetical protein [Candidatus Margulisiibacteriota bacterium]